MKRFIGIFLLLWLSLSMFSQELNLSVRGGKIYIYKGDYLSVGASLGFKKNYFIAEISCDRFYYENLEVIQLSSSAGVSLPLAKRFFADIKLGVGFNSVEEAEWPYPYPYSSFFILKRFDLNYRLSKRWALQGIIDFSRIHFFTSQWRRADIVCLRGSLGVIFCMFKK